VSQLPTAAKLSSGLPQRSRHLSLCTTLSVVPFRHLALAAEPAQDVLGHVVSVEVAPTGQLERELRAAVKRHVDRTKDTDPALGRRLDGLVAVVQLALVPADGVDVVGGLVEDVREGGQVGVHAVRRSDCFGSGFAAR
jgi:hypothetical protein